MKEPKHLILDPMRAGISHAGDLGYTYGSYKTAADSARPAGYYVRIWKRNEAGHWKLVVDKEAPVEND
jgi:ketosteroid isomerase-like protein